MTYSYIFQVDEAKVIVVKKKFVLLLFVAFCFMFVLFNCLFMYVFMYLCMHLFIYLFMCLCVVVLGLFWVGLFVGFLF